MELIIGFLIAIAMVALLSEDESLEEAADRRYIRQLADQSRARKAPGTRRRCRYMQAGWRPEH